MPKKSKQRRTLKRSDLRTKRVVPLESFGDDMDVLVRPFTPAQRLACSSDMESLQTSDGDIDTEQLTKLQVFDLIEIAKVHLSNVVVDDAGDPIFEGPEDLLWNDIGMPADYLNMLAAAMSVGEQDAAARKKN